ncbi:Plancitoxin-1 [Channa argus]|uniref:Deoxyribonuclease-2-alpha n=1 Tax=Channa argus TaxID=215402 RepID=A0A6G1QGZ9_CHAAH|nr:Plancitoxin-1 [Channa argus]KAK2887919.1 hypothetical protein Q8A73_019367 [Channa argus]
MWRLVLTVSLLCCSSEASVTCKDENDGEVDWFILYKAPKNVKYQNKVTTGLEFIFISPQGSTITAARNQKPIDDPNGILANTLRPLFNVGNNKPPDFGFISYSDQPPDHHAGHTYGHSKGVVMLDQSSGVWLLHSTPRFPYRRDKNFWPSGGSRNAQTFICVTFPYDQFEKIGKHLQYIRAYAFEHHIPTGFHDELQKVKDQVDPVPPSSVFQDLQSKKGQMFHSISKQLLKVNNPPAKKQRIDPSLLSANTVGDADLYVAILKKADSPVKVQSWGCQRGRVKNSWTIDGKTLENTECLKTDFGNWKPSKDHSKWCVTTDQNKPFTCIADVNRSESQFERPGGALCIKNEEITNILKGMIGTVADCNADSDCDPNIDSDD